MTNFFKINFLIISLFFNSILLGDDAANDKEKVKLEDTSLIYFGLGQGDDSDPYASDSTPWAIGFMVRDINGSYGFDIAGEGTMLDSTYGQNEAIDQGLSIILLPLVK